VLTLTAQWQNEENEKVFSDDFYSLGGDLSGKIRNIEEVKAEEKIQTETKKIMNLKFLGTAMCLLFCAQLNAQNLDVKTLDGSIKVSSRNVTTTQVFDENKSLIGEVKDEGDLSKLSDQVVKILSVETEAKSVIVYADDVDRNPVELPKAGENRWLIPNAQKLWIEVRVVDFEKNIFDSKRIVVDSTEPAVDPDVPDNKPPIDLPGLRVMMVVESAELPNLPRQQIEILFSEKVRMYLNQRCELGKDGVPEWRVMDPDTIFPEECDLVWCKALKRDRDSVPWVVISNGKTGYEGPLPNTSDEFIELVKKY
tara:strand:- start:1699 stop:2628 length:930 start_codon:yes stop_codon:yes gene_type:complete